MRWSIFKKKLPSARSGGEIQFSVRNAINAKMLERFLFSLNETALLI
jgi:hypothetical protein